MKCCVTKSYSQCNLRKYVRNLSTKEVTSMLEKAIDIARTYVLSKQQLKTFSQFKLDVIKTKPNTSLKSYSGHSITPKYVVKIPCTFKTSTHDIQFYIVDIDATPVLGAKTCSDLGLVKRMYSIQSNENELFENNQTYEIPADIQKNYADVFKGIGCIPGEHSTIKIDSTVQPVVHTPRKVPIAIKDKVKEELEAPRSL